MCEFRDKGWGGLNRWGDSVVGGEGVEDRGCGKRGMCGEWWVGC